jgi:hypothetical protein
VKKMMKFVKFVFVVGFIFGGWALAAASLHVVRAPGTMAWGYIPLNVQLIPKNTLTFHETYVDTTKWSVVDASAHPSFVDRLRQANKLDLVKKAMETPAPVSVTVKPVTPATPATPATVVAEGGQNGGHATVDPKPAASAQKQQPTSIFDFSDQKN